MSQIEHEQWPSSDEIKQRNWNLFKPSDFFSTGDKPTLALNINSKTTHLSPDKVPFYLGKDPKNYEHSKVIDKAE